MISVPAWLLGVLLGCGIAFVLLFLLCFHELLKSIRRYDTLQRKWPTCR